MKQRGNIGVDLAIVAVIVGALTAAFFAGKSYLDGIDAKAYARGKLEGQQETEHIWQKALSDAHDVWEQQNKTLADKVGKLSQQLEEARGERDTLNEELMKREVQHEVDRPAVCTFTADELCDWNDASAGHSGSCRAGQPAGGPGQGALGSNAALPAGAAASQIGDAGGGQGQSPPGGEAIPRMR